MLLLKNNREHISSSHLHTLQHDDSSNITIIFTQMSMFSWFQSTCVSTVGDVVQTEPELISVDCHAKVKDVLDLLNSSHTVTIGVYGEAGHWLGNSFICLARFHIYQLSIIIW